METSYTAFDHYFQAVIELQTRVVEGQRAKFNRRLPKKWQKPRIEINGFSSLEQVIPTC